MAERLLNKHTGSSPDSSFHTLAFRFGKGVETEANIMLNFS